MHTVTHFLLTAFTEYFSSCPDVSLARGTLLDLAKRYVGTKSMRYRGPEYGMDPSQGFDCSGFVLHCLRQLRERYPAILIPNDIRHANEMFDRMGIVVHSQLASPGDMVFFSRTGRMPTHVGFIYQVDQFDGLVMIHAPGLPDTHVETAPIECGSIPVTSTSGRIYAYNPIGYKRLTYSDPTINPRYQIPFP